MASVRISLCLLGLFVAPHHSFAEGIKFYLSKGAIDCIVANEAMYIAAKSYDFSIIFPAICPELPDIKQTTVGNEYLQLPDPVGLPPKEPEAIIVPIGQFSCLRALVDQTTGATATDLFLIDLEICSILQQIQPNP